MKEEEWKKKELIGAVLYAIAFYGLIVHRSLQLSRGSLSFFFVILFLFWLLIFALQCNY
uniref:Uncharacterized protein n=1 Tax=Rhizophora mucronata TaxID=61149 RepID=A0A2P2KKV3_RHIMU